MIVAIIGSRVLSGVQIEKYLPIGTTETVTGGAIGVDKEAENYAQRKNIKLTVFHPDYARYKKGAPLKRNVQIFEYADEIIAFWDGLSKGTAFVISESKKRNKKITVYTFNDGKAPYDHN